MLLSVTHLSNATQSTWYLPCLVILDGHPNGISNKDIKCSHAHYLTVDERRYDSLSRWLFTLYRISFPLRHMHIGNV